MLPLPKRLRLPQRVNTQKTYCPYRLCKVALEFIKVDVNGKALACMEPKPQSTSPKGSSNFEAVGSRMLNCVGLILQAGTALFRQESHSRK